MPRLPKSWSPDLSTSEIISRAKAALTARNVHLKQDPIPDGEFHRAGSEKKPNGTDVSYVLHADGLPVLRYWNFHNGGEGESVRLWDDNDNGYAALSKRQKDKVRKRIKELQEDAERKRLAAYEKAALRAQAELARLSKIGADIAGTYLEARGVMPAGDLRIRPDMTVVMPLLDADGKLWSYQELSSDGSKCFLPFGRTGACFFPVPAPDGSRDGPLLIAEGLATALSAYMATGHATLVALYCGNLKKVAEAARKRYPDRKICILADCDNPSGKYTKKGGPGYATAREAARAAGCNVAFCPEVADGKGDFNDLHQQKGLEAVAAIIKDALKIRIQTIDCSPGKLDEATTALVNALRPMVYEFAGDLVQIIEKPTLPCTRLQNGPQRVASIDPIKTDCLLSLADQCTRWFKTGKEGKTQICNPPREVAERILANRACWSFPKLAAVINGPILRADGSLLCEPGYDRDTGLYMTDTLPDLEYALPFAKEPTEADALEALATLREAISEFPFKTDVDEAVALAAILTTGIRPSVNATPMFAFVSPAPGTGKTTLANLVSIIYTGMPQPPMPFNPVETEFNKAVFASRLAGQPVTLIDNAVGAVNSMSINICLTEQTITDRLLGQSKMASAPTVSLWMITGNNLRIAGDLVRRTLACELDFGDEHPERRSYMRGNFLEWAMKNRATLLLAVLRILTAWSREGMERKAALTPMASFENWSEWVRGALVWLGMPDPVKSQNSMTDADPLRAAHAAVLHAWAQCYGDKPVPVAQVFRECVEPKIAEPEHLALGDAFRQLFDRPVTTYLLGNWLRNAKDRVVNKMKFVGGNGKNHVIYWRIDGLLDTES